MRERLRCLLQQSQALSLVPLRRGLATSSSCSLLQSPHYVTMKETLEKSKEPLGALEKTCRYVLNQPDIQVNEKVLQLKNASSPSCYTCLSKPAYRDIREMKDREELKLKGFTSEDMKVIKRNYQSLVKMARVKKKLLDAELAERSRKKSFHLQRQLVGFYLLQGLDDGDRRLPVEVVAQLCVMYKTKPFTEEEDRHVLEWVEEMGPTGWKQLAQDLGRSKEPGAHKVVEEQYKKLMMERKKQRDVILNLKLLKLMELMSIQYNPSRAFSTMFQFKI